LRDNWNDKWGTLSNETFPGGCSRMKFRLPFHAGLTASALVTVAMTATGVLAQSPAAPNGPAELTVQYDHPLHAVSPTLYGLMTEEINHSYDGGLYAELIQDRTFFHREHNSFHKVWNLDQNAENGISISVDDQTGPSSALPYSLKLTAAKASPEDPGGLDNPGYWGVPVWPDTTYRASIYLKSAGADNPGPVTMAIVNKSTGRVMASATFPTAGPEWKQYTATMRTGDVAESEDNFVRITVSHPGSVLMNVPSLFPPTYDNQKNGDRIDLMKKMAAMHRSFCVCRAGITWRAIRWRTGMTGRLRSARLWIVRRIRVRGGISRLTGWACWSTWSGARICTFNRCWRFMPGMRWTTCTFRRGRSLSHT
jgi:hypothetical protein